MVIRNTFVPFPIFTIIVNYNAVITDCKDIVIINTSNFSKPVVGIA